MTGDNAKRRAETARIERLFPDLEVVPELEGSQLSPVYAIVRKRDPVREREEQGIRYYWIGPSFKCMDELGDSFDTTQDARWSCLRHINSTTQNESEDTQRPPSMVA